MCSITLSSFAHKLYIMGANLNDHIYIKKLDDSPLEDFIISTKNTYEYTNLGEKIKIRRVLPSGEYIERIYTTITGETNQIFMGMGASGFSEDDRRVLENIATNTKTELEKRNSLMSEIYVWLIKANKNIQPKP